MNIGNHTSHIEGMGAEERRALLDGPLRHATRPDVVYEHKWHPRDLVMGDNRRLKHCASTEFDMENERLLPDRTILSGSVPV